MTLTFSLTDEEALRDGTRYYKVTVIGVDGMERPGSEVLIADAAPTTE